MHKHRIQTLLFVLLCILAAFSYWNNTKEKALSGPYTIIRVTDGDTIHVEIEGEDTTIRLIGIDAPESVSPNEEENSEEGILASKYLKDLLPEGTLVWLEYDEEKLDIYQRTLAYVYLDSQGENRVEDHLLKNGMASCLTIPPNTRYQTHFESLEQTAKANHLGIWQ